MATSTPREYALGIVMIVAATVCWSVAGLFVRLLPGLDAWQINAGRGVSMAIAVSIWLLFAHGRKLPAVFRAMPLFAFVVFASQFAIGSTFYAVALTHAPVANVACIGAVTPILTAVVAAIAIGERVSAVTWFAAILAFAGVAYIFHDGLQAGAWLGNLAAFGASACWAVQAVVLRGYRQFDMMPALVMAGLLTFAVGVLLSGGLAVPRELLLPLFTMGVIQLAVPIVLYARGARHVPAATAGLILLLDSILNPLWAFLGVGERPPEAAYVGGIVIVAAVAMTIIGGRRAAA